MKIQSKRKLNPDPRTQLLMLVFLGIAVLLADVRQLLFLNSCSLIYLLLCGKRKEAARDGILLSAVWGIHSLIMISDYQVLKFFAFITFLILRFMPLLILASILQDTPSGKLIASLRKLGIPKQILFTLAVTLRFFPIIQQENSAIQVSAKQRGLSFSQPANWLHPLASFEYTFVPLMMRTLKISDELAASAATRGIDYPGERTSIYEIRLETADYFLFLVFIACLIFAFII